MAWVILIEYEAPSQVSELPVVRLVTHVAFSDADVEDAALAALPAGARPRRVERMSAGQFDRIPARRRPRYVRQYRAWRRWLTAEGRADPADLEAAVFAWLNPAPATEVRA